MSTGAVKKKPIKVTLTLRNDELANRLLTHASESFPNHTLSQFFVFLLMAMYLPGESVREIWQRKWGELPLVGAFVGEREKERAKAEHEVKRLSAEIAALEARLRESRSVLKREWTGYTDESSGVSNRRLALVR